jgi:8-oxo-dGTP pyrophosphatase MutT (NUDIX family)
VTGVILDGYVARDPIEAADVARVAEMIATSADPWARPTPLHLTASALIIHPASGQVLLRWHERQRAWLQVGGHADPGEADPVEIALRESYEETGLSDLVPWPDASLLHVVIVPVPALADDPAHEHADLRYLLATDNPSAARAERASAPVRWFTVDDAAKATREDNLRETLARVGQITAA